MDEDEFKDFDSDNTSDPDGFVEDDTEDEQEPLPMTDTAAAAAAAAGRPKGGPKEEELLGEDVRRPLHCRILAECGEFPGLASRISFLYELQLIPFLPFVFCLAQGKPDPRLRHLSLPSTLPYEVESLAEMDRRLALILTRLTEAIGLRDWDVGFWRWQRELGRWLAMKYPMQRATRVRLVELYYELAVSPGMDARLVETFASTVLQLVEKKSLIGRSDVLLPWRPIYDILSREIFPKGRKTGLTNVSGALLSLCEGCQRFFDPRESDAMLDEVLGRMDGNDINVRTTASSFSFSLHICIRRADLSDHSSNACALLRLPSQTVIATQAFLVHFLPLTHPQRWLPMMFKLGESFASATFDDQMLDLLSRLAEIHVDPAVSDPAKLTPDYVYTADKREEEEDADADDEVEGDDVHRWRDSVALGDNGYEPDRPAAPGAMDVDGVAESGSSGWRGIGRDVGIFTEEEFKGIMTICLTSMSECLLRPSTSVRLSC